MEQDQFEAIIQFALQGVLAPFIATLLTMGVAIRFGRRSPVFSGLALTAGFLAGYFVAYRPSLPPVEIQDYFAYFAVAALGLFAVFDLKPLPAFLNTFVKILFSLVLIMIVVRPLTSQWGAEKTLQTVVAIMLVWITIWINLENGAKRQQSEALVVAIVAIGGGISIMLAYSALIGQLCLAAGVSLATWQLLHLFHPETRLGNTGVAIPGTVLASVLLTGYYYAAMPVAVVALLLVGLSATPMTAALRYFNPQMSETKSRIIRLLLAILPTAVALGLSIHGAGSGDGY